MITRAIALLIVIGDEENLKTDSHWAKFIEYIENNDEIIRKKIHPRITAL